MDTAKVFWSGRSQAVRLPKAYRFETSEVRIHRRGAAVVLEPVAEDWSWLDGPALRFDADATEAAQEPVTEQVRPSLDTLFP